MTPLPVLADCWEANIRPAMCLPATMLPTTRTSKDGNGLSLSASDGPPFTMSAHVIVLAGIWMIMLHGTTIGVLLIVTVPPRRWGSVTSGQALLSALTVASWMKPVSSKPWTSVVAVEKTGSGRVGVMNGEIAPWGGLAVPPLAYAMTAPATSTAVPRTIASVRRVHPCRLRFLRSICRFPPSVGMSGLKTFVAEVAYMPGFAEGGIPQAAVRRREADAPSRPAHPSRSAPDRHRRPGGKPSCRAPAPAARRPGG